MKRESNIELLRIFLMMMIVCWHLIISKYDVLPDGKLNMNSYAIHEMLWLLPILCPHVDCFIFISGYFGIKLKRITLISFITQLLFYSVVTWGGQYFIEDEMLPFSTRVLFPITYNGWWFFTVYLMLMVLSPLLNSCNDLDKKSFGKLLLLYTFFILGLSNYLFGLKNSCIGDLTLFIYIYLLGRYFKMYSPFCSRKTLFWVILLLICVFFNILGAFIFRELGIPNRVLGTFSYYNPIVIVMAISLFFLFKTLTIPNSRIINTIAGTVFATYLITESYMKACFMSLFNFSGLSVTLVLFLVFIASVVIVLMVFPIELLRKKLFVGINSALLSFSYRIYK